MERPEGPATAASFRDLTGGDAEYAAWQAFYADVTGLAEVVAPTLLDPLPTERTIREASDPSVWDDVVARPLGEAIERRFSDDTVRGVVATEALIGTFASLARPVADPEPLLPLPPDRQRHRRVAGAGGRHGRRHRRAGRAATEAGAEIITSAGVSGIRADDDGAEVTWHDGDHEPHRAPRHVLANVAPWVLRILMGEGEDAETKPQGSQLKINLLLDRLPQLRSGVDPRVAFAGTLYLAEDYTSSRRRTATRSAGRLPSVSPGGSTASPSTDPAVLGDSPDGMHALTFFGAHTPASPVRA